jgi:hypothetical protein
MPVSHPPPDSQRVRSCGTACPPANTGTVGVVTVPRDRWAIAALLVGTAVLYLPNLSASGYGNDFYAAAAQAGSQSWSAWFFGSLDAHNFITDHVAQANHLVGGEPLVGGFLP